MKGNNRLPGTPMPMHFWKGFGGLRLAGDSWGEPGRPLVVLQHGGGQTRHAWKNTGERLASAGYHVIAFDARGHGDSDWAPDGSYSQDAMVKDLQHVLAAMGTTRPVLVGASMGGGTSLAAIGEGHCEAAALVLVDVAPRVEHQGVENIQTFMRRNPEGFASLEEVADAISVYQPHRPRPKSLEGLGKNVRLGEDGRYHWHWDPRFLPLPRDLIRRQRRLEECARSLSLPTLLVRGGMSDILTAEGAREFLQMCPHSEYVEIAAAGHMVAGDLNDVFANAIVSFLSRVTPSVAERTPTKPDLTAYVKTSDQELNDIP